MNIMKRGPLFEILQVSGSVHSGASEESRGISRDIARACLVPAVNEPRKGPVERTICIYGSG